MFATQLLLALLSLPTPAPASEVAPLLADLDHDEFEVRSRASARLAALGEAAWPHLCVALRSDRPEVRGRAGALAATLRARRLASLGPPPEIDAFWYDVWKNDYNSDEVLFAAAIRGRLLPYLARAGGGDGLPWTNYYRASQLWAEDMVDAGVPPWAIRALWRYGHWKDGHFLRRHEYNGRVPRPAEFFPEGP